MCVMLNCFQTLELLWGDFCHKLNDQVMGPLNIYQSQFPEVRVSCYRCEIVLTVPYIPSFKFLTFALFLSRGKLKSEVEN